MHQTFQLFLPDLILDFGDWGPSGVCMDMVNLWPANYEKHWGLLVLIWVALLI